MQTRLQNFTSESYKLSPSDFAFLWEECRRCFYLKVKHNFQRPRTAMPKIFTVIDLQMKACFANQRLEDIAPGSPAGELQFSEKWVQSTQFQPPGSKLSCYLRGKFDTVARFDDGTYGVIDFKTSEVKPEHLHIYTRQLHAYAYALENPASGKFALAPISKLGLLVFEPHEFSNEPGSKLSLHGKLGWIEIPRADQRFKDFLVEVLALLEQSSPPAQADNCLWCQYRNESRQSDW